MECVIELSKGQKSKLSKSRNLGTKLPGEAEKRKGGHYYLKTTSKKTTTQKPRIYRPWFLCVLDFYF